MDLILETAQKDERIRAVYLNGSRTNPNVLKDIFQDYDIVYVVTETASFIKDEEWIRIFGELLMIQEPDKLDKLIGKDVSFDESYGYLMLFKDGNRIDLQLKTKESMLKGYTNDKLTIPLLDKDNILPQIPSPSDSDYWVKKPTEGEFYASCSDFWWCLQNVAKGIWRDELPYAKHMFENVLRPCLDEMVSRWIGMNHNYQISTGKMGKYFKKFLPESHWAMYKETYSDSNYENIWGSIFIACELFRTLAKEIAEKLSFTYPVEDDQNMTSYLMHVRELPANSQEIY